MIVKIKTNSNPYVLDRTINENVVALTEKNAKFIEAIIALDSTYRDDGNVSIVGSTAYYFDEMIKSPNRYEECLRNLIITIDKTNRTHLESTINGREKMLDIILRNCSDVMKLKEAVCKELTEEDHENLFYKLLETMDNHKGNKANNISFASKFIFYARYYLNNCDCSFSKYDSIVSDMLTQYEKIYVDSSISINKFKYKNNAIERKNLSDEEKQNYTYNTYLKYMKAINNILACLEKDNGIKINKSEFDHIIWYSSK